MKNCRLTILKGVLVLLLSICSFISYGSSYYAKLTVTVASGEGKVYVTDEEDDVPTDTEYKENSDDATFESSGSNNDATFWAYAKAEPYYQFDGWYPDEACSNLESLDNPYKPTTYQTASTNGVYNEYQLYAKFSLQTYTITYDYNYDNITSSDDYNYVSTITIRDPDRSGYVFDYWTVSSPSNDGWQINEIYYAGQPLMNRHENVTLLAHWRGNLTITSVGLDATDNVIYDVSSMDGESDYHLVADINNPSNTIIGIPNGEYLVTPMNDWSLKYNPVQAQKVTIESGVTSSLSFTFSKRTSPNNISETSRTF